MRFIFIGLVPPRKIIFGKTGKKYSGVGGHLFAIAGKKSIEYGFDGFVFAEAMDEKILSHYQEKFQAEKFPFGVPPHPYRFIINQANMKKIIEEYSYEDTDEEI